MQSSIKAKACIVINTSHSTTRHVYTIRVREIAYGFGGPSEKMSVLINFLLQNTNLVSVLSQICLNFAGHV